MSDDSEALIREIEEEVRREKLTKLWNQYGTVILGGVAAVVVLIGGWQWYSAYQLDRAQTAGSQYLEALTQLNSDKKTDGVAALEQIAKQGTPAYAVLAKMRLAASKREAGEDEAAIALYQVVAGDTSADALIRSFANLQIASLKVDTGTWTEAQNRLNDLANDSSTWRHTARELLGLAAYKHKKWAEAKEAYASLLGDQSAPQAIRQRAQIALALITREEPNSAPAVGADSGDLKKDKTDSDGGQSTAGAGDAKKTTESSGGTAAKNDSEKK